MLNPSTPTRTTDNDVTLITGSGRKPLWNYTEAAEPISKKTDRPSPDMLSPYAVHRYLLLILATALAITLMVLIDHLSHPPVIELLGAVIFGWLVGQFWRWEPPR